MPIKAKKRVVANIEAIKRKIREQKDQPQAEWRVEGHDGLVLITRPSGVGIFHFFYRPQLGGKQRKPKIGEFPTVSLADAIRSAMELRLQVEKGGDPALDRAVQKASMTFKELAEKFLAESDLADTTRQTYTWTFKKDVYPIIGDKPASTVTADFIFAICDSIRKRGTTRQQQATKTAIGGVYKWGITRGYVKTNPTRDVPNQAEGKSERDRVPTDAEIAALWNAPDGTRMSAAMRIIIRLGILVGQRRTQIAGTRAVELRDLDGERPMWVIPARATKRGKAVGSARTKNAEAQTVHLSTQAAALFAEALGTCSNGEYVFPADTDRVRNGKTRKPHIHGESVTKAITRARTEDDALKQARANAAADVGASEIEELTFHDLRRAIASYLGNREDVSDRVIQMILHHEPDDVTGRHYDKAKREAQLRRAWQLWADHVSGLTAEPEASTT